MNTLPMKIQSYPSAYIANTDPSSKPGQHWVVFFFRNANSAEFFDSYGRAPDHYNEHFINFIRRNTHSYVWNTVTLQQNNSQVCGYYVLYYLLMKCRNMPLKDIVQHFSNDKRENDVNVYEYMYHYVNKK